MSDTEDPRRDLDEAHVRDLFNTHFPRAPRRRRNRREVRRVIERAQGEVWLRDVVTFAAAGLTR